MMIIHENPKQIKFQLHLLFILLSYSSLLPISNCSQQDCPRYHVPPTLMIPMTTTLQAWIYSHPKNITLIASVRNFSAVLRNMHSSRFQPSKLHTRGHPSTHTVLSRNPIALHILRYCFEAIFSETVY